MFQVNENDLDYLFEQAGQNILVNNSTMEVIVTNPPLGQYGERFIHSRERVLQGDMITLEGEYLNELSLNCLQHNQKKQCISSSRNSLLFSICPYLSVICLFSHP